MGVTRDTVCYSARDVHVTGHVMQCARDDARDIGLSRCTGVISYIAMAARRHFGRWLCGTGFVPSLGSTLDSVCTGWMQSLGGYTAATFMGVYVEVFQCGSVWARQFRRNSVAQVLV